VSLALKTAVFLAGCSKSTKLAVLVNWVADPVNSRVVTNDGVGWVYKNHLKVLVHGILIHPVRVEHAKSTAFTSNTLLSQIAKVSDWLELSDTLVDWLSIHNTLHSTWMVRQSIDQLMAAHARPITTQNYYTHGSDCHSKD
jgi:hypothetical protein